MKTRSKHARLPESHSSQAGIRILAEALQKQYIYKITKPNENQIVPTEPHCHLYAGLSSFGAGAQTSSAQVGLQLRLLRRERAASTHREARKPRASHRSRFHVSVPGTATCTCTCAWIGRSWYVCILILEDGFKFRLQVETLRELYDQDV